jgi:hypothetical protein
VAGDGEPLGDARRHPPQLVVEPLAVGDVALEGLLVADRHRLRLGLEPAWVDTAGPVAQEQSDPAR